jgi:dTDP-4-amino-4,6-dideoxygalactose transaminase
MWARKRFDIGWRDLIAAVGYSLGPGSRVRAEKSAEQTWPGGGDCIACLSVRSGLHLMLSELNLPAGSEVLISAITIEDMVTILRHHRLIPVPIDLDPADMSPNLSDIERAITPRTCAILIAHLFGTRLPMAPIAALARHHKLVLWEDCAQAFDGRYAGDPGADAVMFSFGPIKTATALGGALLRVRDGPLLARMRSAQTRWPVSSGRTFASRIAKYALLKFLSGRIVFRVVVTVLHLTGRDLDSTLNGTVRNFPGKDLLTQLQHRAPTAMLRLLARRLRTFRSDRHERQARMGRRLADRIAAKVECPGAAASDHSFWVFPICVPDAAAALKAARDAGFDASATSQMRVVPDARGSLHATPHAVRLTKQAVYLPLYPELDERDLDRLAAVLTSLPEARGAAA